MKNNKKTKAKKQNYDVYLPEGCPDAYKTLKNLIRHNDSVNKFFLSLERDKSLASVKKRLKEARSVIKEEQIEFKQTLKDLKEHL